MLALIEEDALAEESLVVSESPMAPDWYCRISGEEDGPLTAGQLRAMVNEGRLTPGDAVRHGRLGAWVPAASVKGLFAVTAEPATELPAPPLPSEASHPARPRPLLRAVPMVEEPPALPPNPGKKRLTEHRDAGLDLTSMPAAESSAPAKPPRQLKGWRATGLDFLAETQSARSSDPKVSIEATHRHENSAESLRRWTVPVLLGTFVLLVVVWIVLVQVRNSDTSSSSADAPTAATSGTASSNSADQRPGGKGLQGPPPIPKSASTGATEPSGVTWINAAREPWKCGDVTVKVLKAEIGRAKLIDGANRVSDSQDNYLLLTIEVANLSATRKIQYKSWSLRDNQVRLTDDLKNPYTLQAAPGGASFEGQQRTKSLYPEKAVEDILVFERPVERARTLRLQLPAGAFEESGVGYLEISMSMVKSDSGPTFRPPPPGPLSAKAMPAAPKKDEKTTGAPPIAAPTKPATASKVPAAPPPARQRTPETDFGIKPDETPAPPGAAPAPSAPAPLPKGSPTPPNGKAG